MEAFENAIKCLEAAHIIARHENLVGLCSYEDLIFKWTQRNLDTFLSKTTRLAEENYVYAVPPLSLMPSKSECCIDTPIARSVPPGPLLGGLSECPSWCIPHSQEQSSWGRLIQRPLNMISLGVEMGFSLLLVFSIVLYSFP